MKQIMDLVNRLKDDNNPLRARGGYYVMKLNPDGDPGRREGTAFHEFKTEKEAVDAATEATKNSGVAHIVRFNAAFELPVCTIRKKIDVEVSDACIETS